MGQFTHNSQNCNTYVIFIWIYYCASKINHKKRTIQIKTINIFLIFLLLQTNIFSIAGTDNNFSTYNTNKRIDCLAPRSNFTEIIPESYGIKSKNNQTLVFSTTEHISEIKTKKSKAENSLTKKLTNIKNLIKGISNFFKRSVFIVLFSLLMLNMPLQAQDTTTSPQLQYSQNIETMLIDRGGMNSYIQNLLTEDAIAHSDYKIRTQAINILTTYHSYPQIYEIITNANTPIDTKKEAILAMYRSSPNNIYFLGEIIYLLDENNFEGENNSIIDLSLSMLEDALSANPVAFQNIQYASTEKRIQLQKALLLILEDNNKPKISRQRATQTFLKTIQSYEDLAKIIAGYDSNLQPTQTISPIKVFNEPNTLISHNLENLRNAAEEELHRRIALTLISEYAHKQNLDNTVLESILGQKQIYSRIFLPALQNFNYNSWWLNATMPEIAERINTEYNTYINQVLNYIPITGDPINISTYTHYTAFESLASPIDVIREEALQLLIANNSNTALLHTASTSAYADLRQQAAAHLADNTEMMLRLYQTAEHQETKLFAKNNLYRLAAQSPADFISTASTNEAFRNMLIELIIDSDTEESRDLILFIYVKSQPTTFDLIGISETISSNKNINEELKNYLNEKIQNEIILQLSKNLIQYKIDAYNTRYAGMPFVNKDRKIIEYENILNAIANNNNIDISILNNTSPDIIEEANRWFSQLLETYNSTTYINSITAETYFQNLKDTFTDVYTSIVKMFNNNQKTLKYLLFLPALILTIFLFARKNKTKKTKNTQNSQTKYDPPKHNIIDTEKENRKQKTALAKNIIDNINTYMDLSETHIDTIKESLMAYKNLHYSYLTVNQENKMLDTCINLVKDPSVNKIQKEKTKEIIRILLCKIIKRSHSSSEDNLRKKENQPEEKITDKKEKESVLSRLKSLFSKEGRMDKDFLQILSKHEGEKKIFTTYVKKSRKEILGVTILLTFTKFLMIVLPFILNLFSIVPISMLVVWVIAISFIGLTDMINQLFLEGITQLYDKKLASTVEKLIRNNKINSDDKPKVYRITTSETGRWKILQMVSGVIGIFLGLIFVKPIILPIIIPVTIISFAWIFYSTLKHKGIDDTQTEYLNTAEKYNRQSENHDFVSKNFNMDKHWEEVNQKRIKYHKSSLLFSSILFLFINIIIPTAGIIFGVPVFGFLISTYMNFFFKSNHVMRQISEGVFHTKKLKKIIGDIEQKSQKSSIALWDKEEASDIKEKQEIEDIQLREMSIKIPNSNNVYILRKQNITFKKGDITYISAPSGAGKTIFAQTIAFERTPDSGDILINTSKDKELWLKAEPKNFTLSNIKEKIQYHSFTSIDNKHSVEIILDDLGIYKNKKEIFIEQLRQIMPEFIEQDLKKAFIKFSAGQRRKIKLIMILMARETPSHLILDEPFAGMDNNSIKHTLFFLKQWQKKTGTGIIIMDHAKIDAQHFTKSISLSNGEIINYQSVHMQQKIIELLQNEYNDSIYQYDLLKQINNCNIEQLPLDSIQEELHHIQPVKAGKTKSQTITKKNQETETKENLSTVIETDTDKKTYINQQLLKSLESYSELFPRQAINIRKIKRDIEQSKLIRYDKNTIDFFINIKTASLVLSDNSITSYINTKNFPAKTTKQLSEFVITAEMLLQHDTKKQRAYLKILRESDNENDRYIYLALENMLIKNNITNINDSTPIERIKAFINIIKDTDKDTEILFNLYTTEELYTAIEKHINKHIEESLNFFQIKTKQIHKINIADYIHIMKFIIDKEYLKNFNVSILFSSWSKTIKNLSILQKYKLNLTHENIKLIKQEHNEAETDQNLLTTVLKKEANKLSKIKKGEIYTFSAKNLTSNPRWKILQNIRLQDPIKFDFIAGKAISDYKLYKHITTSMDQAFGKLWENIENTSATNKNNDNVEKTKSILPSKDKEMKNSSDIKNKHTNKSNQTSIEDTIKQDHPAENKSSKTKHKKYRGKILKKIIIGLFVVLFGLTGIKTFILNETTNTMPMENKTRYVEWENTFSEDASLNDLPSSTNEIQSINTFASIKEDILTTIASEESGTLTFIREEGPVQTGEILFTYTNPSLTRDMTQAADHYNLLKTEYERLNILFQRNAGIARNDLLNSEALMNQAKIELDKIQIKVNSLTVRAPIDGNFIYNLNSSATLRTFILGQSIIEDETMGYIENIDTKRITFNINTTDIPDNLYPGTETSININDNITPVKILKVSGTPNIYNSSFQVECLIDSSLLPETQANLQISLPRRLETNDDTINNRFNPDDYFKAAGFTIFREQQIIRSPEEGYINGLRSDIYEGDIINETDNNLRILNHAINYDIQKLYSQQNIAERMLDIDTRLQAIDAISLADLEKTKYAYQNAHAAYTAAIRQREGLNIPLENNWMISEIFSRNGEWIEKNRPIIRIVNTESIEIQASIGADANKNLEQGDTVFISFPNTNLNPISGTISYIQTDQTGKSTAILNFQTPNNFKINENIPVEIYIPKNPAIATASQITNTNRITEPILQDSLPALKDPTPTDNKNITQLAYNNSTTAKNETPYSNTKSMLSFKLKNTPPVIFGIFAVFTLFALLKNKKKKQKDILCKTICDLIIKGHPLKLEDGNIITLSVLKNIYDVRGIKGLTEVLNKNFKNDYISKTLAEHLSKTKIFNVNKHKLLKYLLNPEIRDMEKWPLPITAITAKQNNNSDISTEKLLEWTKEWTKWFPKKFNDFKKNSNINEELALEISIISNLENLLDNNAVDLLAKNSDTLQQQMTEYINTREKLAEFRWKIIALGKRKNSSWVKKHKNNINKMFEEIKNKGITIIQSPPDMITEIKNKAQEENIILQIYSDKKNGKDIYINNINQDIDTILEDTKKQASAKIIKAFNNSKALDTQDQIYNNTEILIRLAKEPVHFLSEEYSLKWKTTLNLFSHLKMQYKLKKQNKYILNAA